MSLQTQMTPAAAVTRTVRMIRLLAYVFSLCHESCCRSNLFFLFFAVNVIFFFITLAVISSIRPFLAFFRQYHIIPSVLYSFEPFSIHLNIFNTPLYLNVHCGLSAEHSSAPSVGRIAASLSPLVTTIDAHTQQQLIAGALSVGLYCVCVVDFFACVLSDGRVVEFVRRIFGRMVGTEL